ncbi:MAG: MBL fold metallo-hydrolase, partial [Sulfurimonas sp.]
TPLDVEQTFKMIKWVHPEYDNYYDLCEGISFVFKNAGHILGSAFIEVSYMDDNDSRSIVFTGDIGNNNELVLPNLTQCERADYLYTETTYGDRDHQPIEATLQEFKETLLTTLERGGNVLIPSFAVERTQEILCILKEMFENDELPKRSQVFLDSPMATRATEVYESYNYELTDKCNNFDFNGLVFTETPEASKNINNVEKGAIIIAGAGMCNGGRIVHHFKHRIWNEKNAVIFVGFQAEKTLGREIVEGAKWINVLGEDIIVKASIHTINGFSAHADRDGMIRWISGIKNLQKVFLVHGEIESQNAFKETLKKELNIDAHIVGFKEKIVLD